jgi:hypothetical protein
LRAVGGAIDAMTTAAAPVPPLKSRAEVDAAIQRLAQALGEAPPALPLVEVDEAGYHVVVLANAREVLRESTTDFDELLYWVFSGATHELAFAHGQAHRVEGQDPRRLAFARQLELLARLDPAMAARRTEEIRRILESAPYRDCAAGARGGA